MLILHPLFSYSTEKQEQTTYNLSLEAGGKLIDMKKSQIDILCMSPCLIREDHRILFVSDVDGSKIKPFLTKENIVIPKQTEIRYFSSFVLNAVNNFKVENTGFEISRIEPVKEAILDIETGLKGVPVLILKYNYQGNEIYASESLINFTIFEKNSEKIVFRKYQRDFDWEKECRDTLGELGFFSDDEINFLPLTTGSKSKNDLYTLIEIINSNYSEITEAGFTINSRLDANYNLRAVDIEISSKLVNDWFDLKAIVKIGEWEFPFNRFRKNILEGKREFILPDGSIAVLPETWFTRYKNIFEFGKVTDDSLRIHKQHFSLLTDTFNDEARASLERLGKLLVPEQIPVIDAPKGLECNMRQYQAEGLNWLVFLQTAGLGGCLADDMGLGKTIQTLALLQHNKENIEPVIKNEPTAENTLFRNSEPKLTSLLIVPASLIYNWENEIKRFAPGYEGYQLQGKPAEKGYIVFQ